MSDDIAVGMQGRGWSAVGGRVIPPGTSRAPVRAMGRPSQAGELTGRVSFTTSDGLLEPGRRLRYRRGSWARVALVWFALVLLAPLAAGWAWGFLDPITR
jgi:hypothetical protein